ncbi:lymphoid-restricted membrane protein-like [Rhinatrema bivittatum]|uniref:lymphoid-restricted membrane protein-like n=1 Tax=Rhinatrema bivittatum TaxID=194408 RepID=UPI00112708F2|nr:lymphoid-restricted membrane protein-like [Rhinatrema bivittatum]
MESDSQGDSGSASDSRKQSSEEHNEDGATFGITDVREVSGRSGDSADSDEDNLLGEPLANSSTELSILERLGLHRVSLTEQDVEAAFVHLSLAFRCDTFTLRRRVQVEERARDVAEENIQKELEECWSILRRLTVACVDEKQKDVAEQFQQALTVLAGSIQRVTKAAEVLGAVHQEARMCRAVEVMIQHVDNLKRRHSREHTELEDMKRLIQQNSRNRQLAETRDEGEVKSKHHLMRALHQASSRRRVSIAVIPKQFMPFHSSENGKGADCEAAKLMGDNGGSTEGRQPHGLQEDPADVSFMFRTDSTSSRRSLQAVDSSECDGDASYFMDGSELELLRRESVGKPLPEGMNEESDSGELSEENEEAEQQLLTSKGSTGQRCRFWFCRSDYCWALLWLIVLLVSSLALVWVLELQGVEENSNNS